MNKKKKKKKEKKEGKKKEKWRNGDAAMDGAMFPVLWRFG
jgi:hypothetical protein